MPEGREMYDRSRQDMRKVHRPFGDEYSRVCQLREYQQKEFVNAALAAVIMGTVTAGDVLAYCPSSMVTSPVPHAIYRAMEIAHQRGTGRISAAIVWATLNASRNDPELAEGSWPDVPQDVFGQYTVSGYAGNIDSIWHFARLVLNESTKARAEGQLYSLIAECQRHGNESSEIAAGLSVLVNEMESGSQVICPDLSELMEKVLVELRSGEVARPLPTPWPNLNRVLKGGMVPGELVILAARPGVGKTALAGCIAIEAARSGKEVLFISREVKDTTIAKRLLAREARVDNRFFREGIASVPDIIPSVEKAAGKIASLPLRIVEKSIAPMTPREIRRLSKMVKKIDLVVVDYLQLVNPDESHKSREREIAEISRAFKQLALDCNCVVLALSQLNRSVEESSRKPRLSDLRESGAIEQDADIVIMLHSARDTKGQSVTPVEVLVEKGRSSGTGTANLLFDKKYTAFDEDPNPPSSRSAGGGSGIENQNGFGRRASNYQCRRPIEE